MHTFSTKSTLMGLLTRGYFWGILTPWKIEVDTRKKRVHITKRNWYLISTDEDTFQFSSVRHVKIDKSLFGADLQIRMYAGTANVRGISKQHAKQIRDMLLDGMPNNENEIYIDTTDA